MGESAVLLRTFSHPSDASREAREGDPICALTESVSFGRFMSESLAWEKWSTFSHNRYLEEVEKFSKPGSVAEKKAYFEAHYKRKAAMKAEVFEEANAAANAKDVSALKTTKEILNSSYTESAKGNCHEAIEVKEQYMANTSTESPMDTESADMMSHVVTEKQWENDSPNSEVAPADADAPSSISMRVDLGDFDVERGGAAIEYAVNVENPTQVDNLKHLQNPDVHDKIEASPVDRMPNKENSALSSKKKQRSSLSRSLPQSGVSRLTSYIAKRTPSLPARNIKNIATNSEESAGDSNEKRRVDPKSLHISINFSPCVSEPSKASLRKPKGSSTPIRTPTRASVNGGPKHLSKLFQSEDKRSKVLVSKSVSGGITEDWQLQSLPMARGSKSSSTTSSKGRPPCISSPFSFRSEERAAKRKEFSQMLEENKNAKEAEKAPMEIRSKEKAEQDIKKLRQSSIFKAKHNESLYRGSHLPINRIKKEKAEHDTGKLQQSTGIKPKPNESLHHGSLSLSKHTKKKALCKPCSPKHGLKPTPTAVHDTSSRPPRRPSVSTESSKHVIEKNERYTTCSISSLPTFGRRPTSNAVQDANTRPPWRSSMNTASFKCVIEKNNRITNRSVTSLPKKNARENASPNIQHSVSKEKGALFT